MGLQRMALMGNLAICLSGMATVSCEKAESVEPILLPHVAKSDMAWPRYRLRFFNGVDWCYPWQGNCLPDVIVHGHMRRESLNTHFTGMTGNPNAVKEFFSGPYWQEYFPILAEADFAPVLERLRSGECDIKRVEHETKSFYYAGSGDLTPTVNEIVLPVNFEQE